MRHEYKVGPTPNKCAFQVDTTRYSYPCSLHASAECHDLLAEEEADLVVGAIPLQTPGELLPCPFCGSKARFREWIQDRRKRNPVVEHYVECSAWLAINGCGAKAKTKMYLTKDKAAVAWNTRANSQLVTALANALRHTVQKLEVNTRCWHHDSHSGRAEHCSVVGCYEAQAAIADDNELLATLNPPLTQLPLEHVGLKAERKDNDEVSDEIAAAVSEDFNPYR